MKSLLKYLVWSQFRKELEYYIQGVADIDSEAFAVRMGEVPLCPQPEMAVWRLFLHINVNLQNTTFQK